MILRMMLQFNRLNCCCAGASVPWPGRGVVLASTGPKKYLRGPGRRATACLEKALYPRPHPPEVMMKFASLGRPCF